MGIKVIAHHQGYYGQFREVGDEFEIENEEAFHDSWMDRADGKQAKRTKAAGTQTTGNNPLGAKPHAGADTLPPNDLT
ncbi:hypothetical protein [Paraburkholderia atlantica]|uniref:hypothetical protein n=1 Tax=Paraburkholderia atlantica TaxID=2654982 RepID=UPI003D1E8951